MDFHAMKRKQLQALCKKHKVPANLSNLDMASKLTEFFKERENPVQHAVIKEPEEDVREIESIDVVVNKKGKKVRFSPEHELIEFTKSPAIKGRSRRNSVYRKESNWSVKIVESGEMNEETVGRRGSTMRMGELKLVEAEVKQKKRETKAVKCNDEQTTASGLDSFDDGELEEGDVVRSGRVMRYGGKMAAEGVKNVSKRERKRAKGDDTRDEKASDNVKNEEHQEEIVDNRSRLTRSRAQKLTEAPAVEEKRGRKVVKNIGKVAAVRAEIDDNEESSTDSSSKRGDKGEGKSAKGSDERLKETLVNKQIAGEHVSVEPQLLLRRSKRKANMVGESEMVTSVIRKHVNDEVKGSRKTSKLLASDGSKVDAEISGIEVDPSRRAVLEIEEPIQKMEPRRSNRRKTIIESDDLRGDTENRYPLRSSLPQPDIVSEVSNEDKMVIQPIGITRRSRRLKMVSDPAVENLEAEMHISKSCLVEKENDVVQKNTRSRRNTSKGGPLDKIGEDSNIHQENKVVKRKRGRVSGGDDIKNNNDLNSGVQSLKGSSSEKVVSATATGRFADERKQPQRLDNPNMLDASSHDGSSGIGESLILVELSVSKDSESANKLCSKNIISDAELPFVRETHKNKEEVSIADNADSFCMNLSNGKDLVNSDTNAASKSAEQGTDSNISDDHNSTNNIVEVEKGKLLLEVDVEESIEQNTIDMDKNEPQAQVYSQMEDSACNNKVNNQVLAQGLNVFGEEGSIETSSSADSFLLGDQTNVETDLKVAETGAEEHVQPCFRVVDHHNDLEHLEASSNVLDNNNKDTSQSSGEDGAFESCSITRHQGINVAEENETFLHKGRASELAEADEDCCSKDHRNASNHFSAFDMPDLSNGETDARIVSPDRGIFPDEYLVMNSDEHCEDFQSAAPIAICTNSTGGNLRRGHEEDQMTKNEDRYIYEGINSEFAEIRESESSKDYKSKCDEDGEFSLAKLFDEEERYGITPQEKENFFGEHSVKDFNEQGMSHGSPSIAPTTMYNNAGDHEANLSAERETYNFQNKQSELTEADESGCLTSPKSSNSQETNPSTPSSVYETQEKQKSQLVKSNALANTNPRQGALSNASELAGNAVCFLKSSEGKINQVAEGLRAHEDDEEVSVASMSDVKSCPVSTVVAESLGDVKFLDAMETEHQHKNLLARQTEPNAGGETTHATSRRSWTETEPQNLFGASDEDAPPGLGDTICQGSETADMTMSKNKLTASNSGSLAKKQEKEMEGESSDVYAKTKNKNVVLLTGFDADSYENEIKFLFATPVKTEETYSHDRVLDESVTSIKECSDAMKENVTTESTSHEKAQSTGYEVENNLSIGASLSDNGGDDICQETNEVESFELRNTSTRVLSEAEYDGCEVLEDQLAQNKEECLQKTNSITEEEREEHVIPLAQSCLNEEATEKNNICASGSSRDLYELESCEHMSETRNCKSKAHNNSEGGMTQSSKAELSDADHGKSDIPENSHHLTGCSLDGNIMRETSIETSSDPEVTKIGSSEKDVTEKGISPFNMLKASPDCEDSISESDDQYEAKKLDEEDGNPKSSQDISDELHTNSEVAIQESVSIGYNMCQEVDQLPSSDELESTCKEAKGMETTTQISYNTDADPEHGSLVCGAVSGLLSSSAMHISVGYDGNSDKTLEAGEPVFILDDGKVQDAGFELENNLCNGDLLSDDGGEDTCRKMNDVENVALKVTFTTVLSKTEYDGCEASEEQLTENAGECQQETNFLIEDNEEKVNSVGQSNLYDEETDNDSESTKGDSPKNLDKLEGCQDMLIDTALSESLSCKSRVDHISKQEVTQSSEAAVELSDADLQKSNISKNSQNVAGEGTYLLLSSKASPVHDELTQSTDTGDLNGAKICDEIDAKENFSQDMSNELHINSEVAILKSLSDTDNQSEDAGLELESTFLETKESGTTTQDPKNNVAPKEHGSSVCGAVPSMHLHLRDENNSIENLDVGEPVFNLSGDNAEKDRGKGEENSTAQMVQFSIQELHFEENVEDFKNDTATISNLPASGYNEILKESDVADTIKEYIDSESSLSVIFENSSARLPTDMAHTDESIACANPRENDIAGRLDCLTPRTKIMCQSSSKDEDKAPSVDCIDTEIQEQEEATLLIRSAQVSEDAANSPECVAFLDEGTTVKLESQKKIESEDGQSSSPKDLRSTMRKNARTILIHATPSKLLSMADMKENGPTHKNSNVGDITAVRPAKRRALQNLQWK